MNAYVIQGAPIPRIIREPQGLSNEPMNTKLFFYNPLL